MQPIRERNDHEEMTSVETADEVKDRPILLIETNVNSEQQLSLTDDPTMSESMLG